MNESQTSFFIAIWEQEAFDNCEEKGKSVDLSLL